MFPGRRVAPGRTTFENAERDLMDVLRVERQRLVLKPNDDYGGHGVVIGWETSKDDLEASDFLALKRPLRRAGACATLAKRHSIVPTSCRWKKCYDFNPFSIHNEVEGALIRLSSSSPPKRHFGGGQTALLVLEGK